MSTEGPILIGVEPVADLQRAVMRILLNDAELTSMASVYDYVPENESGPYVTWSSAWLAERDTLNGCADRVWFQLDIYSRYRGYAEGSNIAFRVVELLHHLNINIPGYETIHVLREQSHVLRDPNNEFRRWAITFNCPYVSLERER